MLDIEPGAELTVASGATLTVLWIWSTNVTEDEPLRGSLQIEAGATVSVERLGVVGVENHGTVHAGEISGLTESYPFVNEPGGTLVFDLPNDISGKCWIEGGLVNRGIIMNECRLSLTGQLTNEGQIDNSAGSITFGVFGQIEGDGVLIGPAESLLTEVEFGGPFGEEPYYEEWVAHWFGWIPDYDDEGRYCPPVLTAVTGQAEASQYDRPFLTSMEVPLGTTAVASTPATCVYQGKQYEFDHWALADYADNMSLEWASDSLEYSFEVNAPKAVIAVYRLENSQSQTPSQSGSAGGGSSTGASSTGAAAGGSAALPITGAPTLPLSIAALLLVGTGAALVWRRHTTRI
ncbi:MAG: hypothetical protein LBG11_08895 [Bifidobacteriaceae bacterium]|nr:hypothetical protein [Bifidobacteriaceae bacterium]